MQAGCEREECTCAHDKATHYREMLDEHVPGRAMPNQRVVYGACLAAWCDCAEYRQRNQRR